MNGTLNTLSVRCHVAQNEHDWTQFYMYLADSVAFPGLLHIRLCDYRLKQHFVGKHPAGAEQYSHSDRLSGVSGHLMNVNPIFTLPLVSTYL